MVEDIDNGVYKDIHAIQPQDRYNFIHKQFKLRFEEGKLNISSKRKKERDMILQSLFLRYYTWAQNESGELYVFDDGEGYWVDGRKKVKVILGKYNIHYERGEVESIIDNIFMRAEKREEAGVGFTNGYYVKVENGKVVIDKITKDVFVKTYLNTAYNQEAKTEFLMKFLENTLKDEKERDVLKQYLGSILMREYKIKKALVIVGPSDTGKTTFLNVLRDVIGDENVASLSIQDVADNRFAIAELSGKLLNIKDDLPAREIKDTGIFKQMTGDSILRGEKKYGEAFNFNSSAKLIYTCNELPPVNLDDAFFNRLIIIYFYNQIPRDRQDVNLKEKLLAEREGIILWIIEGLKKLVENNFHINYINENIRMEYLRHSSSAKAFVDENIEITGDDSDYIKNNDLWESYKQYCKINNSKMMSQEWFGREINKLTGTVVERWQGIRIRRGIRFKPTVSNEKVNEWIENEIKDKGGSEV